MPRMRRNGSARLPEPPWEADVVSAKEGETGYKRPPVGGRFKPGQSGNPLGRPKGARNKLPGRFDEQMKTIILEEARRLVTVTEGGEQISIPMCRAVVRGLAIKAGKGDVRAAGIFLNMVQATEEAVLKEQVALLEAAHDYKHHWAKVFEECRARGVDPPEPTPHPDDIVICPRSGEVYFYGPVSEEEKRALDNYMGDEKELKRREEEFGRSLEKLIAERSKK